MDLCNAGGVVREGGGKSAFGQPCPLHHGSYPALRAHRPFPDRAEIESFDRLCRLFAITPHHRTPAGGDGLVFLRLLRLGRRYGHQTPARLCGSFS